MLMINGNLRIAMYSGHIPLNEVSSKLNQKDLTEKIQNLSKILKQDFSIRKPKIAVLGINPHAGDNGLLGKEDQEIISPVITEFQSKGDLVYGPFPADGFFGSDNYRDFDGVLAMYHDQGLIPFKALSFGKGTNFTAGLNFVRTSPDHGTAYDICGKNIASNESFLQALYNCIDILRTRKTYLEISKNPLEIRKKENNHRRQKAEA